MPKRKRFFVVGFFGIIGHECVCVRECTHSHIFILCLCNVHFVFAHIRCLPVTSIRLRCNWQTCSISQIFHAISHVGPEHTHRNDIYFICVPEFGVELNLNLEGDGKKKNHIRIRRFLHGCTTLHRRLANVRWMPMVDSQTTAPWAESKWIWIRK